MELPVRLPTVAPTHCYSPSPDHVYEGRRAVSASRQPLQESTGNIQHPPMAWYAQQMAALSSMTSPSVPPLMPPVLRTQSLGADYGVPAYSRSHSSQQQQQQQQQQRHELQPQGRRRAQGCNPLMPLLSQPFQTYRKKQADRPDQKWPQELEGHFLDALLLIPQMGRDKYTMKKTLWGRNQLIGEYLLIACYQSPGSEPAPQMLQSKEVNKIRKKVSSHIQVLKNFFKTHRCYHFLFGEQQRDRDKEKDKVGIGKVSLKNNPILIALSEDRFPSERPNYEYFAQILALNDQVQFRPKRCWIFVSHKDVAVGEDGSGYLAATETRLSESEYPHLARNLERDSWAKEEQQLFKGALLHEFTKEMGQEKAGSVRELTRDWDAQFPELHRRLKTITSTTTDARCDFLHLHATLELNERRSFPSGSSLSSWVEINIEQPRLLNHRWKVETRLVRPPELSYAHDDGTGGGEVVHERQKEFTIKYQHRPRCDGAPGAGRGLCGCLAQRSRREGVSVPFPVPFPATVWAQTLTACAEYPAHPFSDGKRQSREGVASARGGNGDDDEPRGRRRAKQPTQMDLVPRIAMMQEISSCPPAASHEDGGNDSADQRWTLRAVMLWTFETVHSLDKDGKLATAPGGRTDWRFLTILDPASEYHQRHAIVSGRAPSADEYRGAVNSVACGSRLSSRAAVVGPSPTYPLHLAGSMGDSFPSPWDSAGGLGSLPAYGAHFMSQTAASQGAAAEAPYSEHGSFSSHSGLATPPPSASLASSFAQGFDAVSTSAELLPSYMATHGVVTTGGIDTGSHALGTSGLSAVTDPFLAHVGSTYGGAQDDMHNWDSHGVGGTFDPWASGYSNGSTAQPHTGAIEWSAHQHHHQPHHPPTQALPARRGSEHHRTAPRQTRHPWVPAITTITGTGGGSTANSIDDHDPWTPITSAHTCSSEPAPPAPQAHLPSGPNGYGNHQHHQSHQSHHNQQQQQHQQQQQQQHNQHNHPHLHSLATGTTPSDPGQGWVHIAAPSSAASASSASSLSSASASGADLSHDWEHVPASMAGAGAGEMGMDMGVGITAGMGGAAAGGDAGAAGEQAGSSPVSLASSSSVAGSAGVAGEDVPLVLELEMEMEGHGLSRQHGDVATAGGRDASGRGHGHGHGAVMAGRKRAREGSFDGDGPEDGGSDDGGEGRYRRVRVAG